MKVINECLLEKDQSKEEWIGQEKGKGSEIKMAGREYNSRILGRSRSVAFIAFKPT